MTNKMLLCMEKTCEPLSLIVIIMYAFHQCEVSQSHLLSSLTSLFPFESFCLHQVFSLLMGVEFLLYCQI